MGNLESNDLVKWDARVIMDAAVASSSCLAEETRTKQYHTFKLHERPIALSEPIRKTARHCLVDLHPKRSQSSIQVSFLKTNVSLFSRLYIACES